MIPLRHTLPIRIPPWVNRAIVAVNVLVFVALLFLGPRSETLINVFGFIPARLLHPMVRDRRGIGDWRRASWDEVLDRIAERMREAGRQAVATWTGRLRTTMRNGTCTIPPPIPRMLDRKPTTKLTATPFQASTA